MSEKYNEYCMKFSNEELKRIFDKMKHEEVFAEIENVKLNLMPTKVDEFIEKLNNEYETEETQENN